MTLQIYHPEVNLLFCIYHLALRIVLKPLKASNWPVIEKTFFCFYLVFVHMGGILPTQHASKISKSVKVCEDCGPKRSIDMLNQCEVKNVSFTSAKRQHSKQKRLILSKFCSRCYRTYSYSQKYTVPSMRSYFSVLLLKSFG